MRMTYDVAELRGTLLGRQADQLLILQMEELRPEQRK